MNNRENDPGLNPYDCVYQGWSLIAFGQADKDTMEQLPDAFPHVLGIFDSKEVAIELAEHMRKIGKYKYGRDYHFLVQGVPVNGKWPILGLGPEASIKGDLNSVNKDQKLI